MARSIMTIWRTAALLALLAMATPAAAQRAECLLADGAIPGGADRALLRAALLTDTAAVRYTWMVQRPSDLRSLCPAPAAPAPSEAPRLSLLPVHGIVQQRTGYPDDRNTGPFWSGAGTNAGVSAGARLEWGPLTAVAAPMLIYAQNTEFELQNVGFNNRSEFANPYYRTLDWPQRPGNASIRRLESGQSVVRLDLLGAAAGVSTENLWWGPSQRTGPLLSSTAPGFGHVFVGTSGPVLTPAGGLEVDVVWTRLKGSDWFDPDQPDERRHMTGIVAAWTLPVLTGLQLGGARIYHFRVPEGGLAFRTYAFPFIEPLLKEQVQPRDGGENQLASFFVRWALPAAGFEAYWELVRDDHSANMQDLLAQPTHVGGYVLGFQQVWDRGASALRLSGEHLNLSQKLARQAGRPASSLYNHSRVIGGHTHRGSMLGAATGPGSNSTFLSADWSNGGYSAGGYAERVVRDDDTFFRRWAERFSYTGHDLEWTLGARGHVQRQSLRVGATAAFSRRHNMLFIGLSEHSWETRHWDNWLLETRLTWHPRRSLAF